MADNNSYLKQIPFQELLKNNKELANLYRSKSSFKKWKNNTNLPRRIDNINTILLANGKTFNDYIDDIKVEEEIVVTCNITTKELLELRKQAQNRVCENTNTHNYQELIKKIDFVLLNQRK